MPNDHPPNTFCQHKLPDMLTIFGNGRRSSGADNNGSEMDTFSFAARSRSLLPAFRVTHAALVILTVLSDVALAKPVVARRGADRCNYKTVRCKLSMAFFPSPFLSIPLGQQCRSQHHDKQFGALLKGVEASCP